MTEAAQSETHRDFAGQGADGPGGNGIDAALFLIAGVIKPILLFGEILAAAPRTDNHADLAQLLARHGARLDAGVAEGFRDAGHRQRDGARDVRAILDFDILLFIEVVGHFAGNLNGKPRGIESGDAANPALPVLSGFPETLTPDAIRADGADSGDDYATHRIGFV